MELNLPTGIPMVYELDKNLKPVKPMQFLGDEETVRKAMEAVAAQGKAKKWGQAADYLPKDYPPPLPWPTLFLCTSPRHMSHWWHL